MVLNSNSNCFPPEAPFIEERTRWHPRDSFVVANTDQAVFFLSFFERDRHVSKDRSFKKIPLILSPADEFGVNCFGGFCSELFQLLNPAHEIAASY
jgi:hypothetical protein